MSTKTPPPWFEKQEPTSDPAELKKRKARLLEEIPQLMERQEKRGRANSFQPYLLVRSVLGDRGDRPINIPFWESPDIWLAPGDPSVTPAVPANHGGTPTASQPSTVYAHVWNLGFAPLAGIRVEFYWFDPSLGIDGTNGHLLGMARCELAGRGMPGSHTLVKCPKPWVPTMENGGHECLVVRASGIGDPLGGNEWHPWQNRHVAQRNVSVVSAGANVSMLIHSLNASRPFGARLQLVQLSARESDLARHIVGMKIRLANVQTHVLGELDVADVVKADSGAGIQAATLAPVHLLAAGGAPAAPEVHAVGSVPVINPPVLLQVGALTEIPSAVSPLTKAPTAHLSDLLSSVLELQPGAAVHPPPAAPEAHVLRVASYSGSQLVGGYTLVVAGGA